MKDWLAFFFNFSFIKVLYLREYTITYLLKLSDVLYCTYLRVVSMYGWASMWVGGLADIWPHGWMERQTDR